MFVDNDGPVVSIVNPGTGKGVNGFVPIIGTSVRATQVMVKIESLDANGDPDGTILAENPADGSVVWSELFDTTDLPEKNYRVSAWGVRTSPAKVGAVITRDFKVDKTIPNIQFLTPTSSSNIIEYVNGLEDFSGTASDDNGIASVEISFNGGASWLSANGKESWSYSIDTNDLGDGIRTVVARAKDTTGLYATASIPVNIDNKPPEVAITSPVENEIVSGTITARGTSFDAGGVKTVKVWVDSLARADAAGTTNWSRDIDLAALSNGDHTISAIAMDLSSTEGTPASIVVRVDENRPAFGPTTGIANDGYYRQSFIVSGTVTDADVGDTVDSVQVKVGAGAFTNVSSLVGGAWTWNFDSAGMNGQYLVVFRATDNWGGYTDQSFTVILDNTPPALTIDQPANNAQVAGTVQVTGSAGDAYTIDSLTLRISASATMVPVIDEMDIKPSLSSSGMWNQLWDTTTASYPEANYYLQVEAKDTAGNATTVTYTYAKTNSIPSITIGSPTNGSYVPGTIDVSGTAAASGVETLSAIQLSFDGTNWTDVTPVQANWSILGLTTPADGLRTLTAKVTQSGGASSITSIALTVDKTPPTIALTSPSAGATLHGTVGVTGTAADTHLSSVTLTVDGADVAGLSGLETWSYAWDTATVAGVAKTGVTLQARATDLAGNTAYAFVAPIAVDVKPYMSELSKTAATRGDAIVITGYNFSAGSKVNFPNAVNTGITFTSSTSISVVIPNLATSGNVTVTTNGVDSNNAIKLDLWKAESESGSAMYPSLAKDPNGNLYLAYALAQYKVGANQTRAIGLRIMPALGTDWDNEIKINEIAATGLDYSYLSICAETAYVFMAYNHKNGANNLVLSRYKISDGTQATYNIAAGTYNYTSIASFGTMVWVSAFDTVTKRLVAFKSTDSGANWNPVDQYVVDASSSDVGRYSSIALTSVGNPVIAYRDAINKTLRFAYFNGSSWATRTIDVGNVGEYCSVKVDGGNVVHVSYFDSVSGNMKYARAASPTDAFVLESLNEEGIGGLFTSLALDGDKNPHAVNYDFSAALLKYVRKTGSSWESFDIPISTTGETLTYPGTFTGIIFNFLGKPVFVYPTSQGIFWASFIP